MIKIKKVFKITFVFLSFYNIFDEPICLLLVLHLKEYSTVWKPGSAISRSPLLIFKTQKREIAIQGSNNTVNVRTVKYITFF